MNRFFLLFLLLGVFSRPVKGQFIVQTQYHSGFQNDQSTTPITSFLEGSVHYWTRLKRLRLEFMPGFLFQSLQTEQENLQHLGVLVPMSVYPLDFVNDCDCPTFSKNSLWFQKGFFIRLTPSWSKRVNQSGTTAYDQLFGAGISIGLDVGLSDLVTITPLLGYDQIYPLTGESAKSDFLHVGVSFLFRHDYSKRFR